MDMTVMEIFGFKWRCWAVLFCCSLFFFNKQKTQEIWCIGFNSLEVFSDINTSSKLNRIKTAHTTYLRFDLSLSNNSIFASDHKILLQKNFSLSTWSAANFCQVWRCWFWSMTFFLGQKPFSYWQYKTCLTVDSETNTGVPAVTSSVQFLCCFWSFKPISSQMSETGRGLFQALESGYTFS